MSISPILRPRVLVMVALAAILAVSAYGFAAANAVDASGAGDGVAAISGFDITNVVYTFDASAPSNITSVALTILPTAPSTVEAADAKIKLYSGDTYHDCTVTAVTGATTCAITGGVLTSLADNLSVVASSAAMP